LVLPRRKKPFAFFILKDGRTEDMGFFEIAKRAGHQLWCDTGVEVGHVGEKVYYPRDWTRYQMGDV
jgi:hypothetical protein